MCFAWWARVNPDKIHICVRFRKISFWWNFVILGLLLVAHTAVDIWLQLPRDALILIATVDITLWFLINTLDYHYCMVLESYAKGYKRASVPDEDSATRAKPAADLEL